MTTRVTIITGGTRGIGAAVARRLAAEGDPGHRLLLVHRSRSGPAEALVDELEAGGAPVSAVRCDVGDAEAVAELFRSASAVGTVTGLVNAAGTLERQARFADLDPARWRRVFATNVFGTAECCRQAVRLMSTRYGGQGGAIVNLSSRAAELGSPGEYVDYAAGKAAVDTLTRGLALEVATEGVRVNSVRPGIVDTELHAEGGEPDRADRLGPLQPMGRAGTADEVAAAVVWLLSPEASFVTGTHLDVAGGR